MTEVIRSLIILLILEGILQSIILLFGGHTTIDHTSSSHGGHGGHEQHNAMSLDNLVLEINQKNTGKNTVKVLIIKDDNPFSDNYHEDTKRGYHYDVFKMLLSDPDGGLNQNFRYEIYYSNPDENNYNDFVENVNRGDYDMVIGGFSINEERETKINYTIPLYINRIGVLHLNEKKYWKNLSILFIETMKIFGFMVFIAIIFGIILYYIEPHRHPSFKKTKKKESGKSREKRFRRHLLTMISTFFGEMGNLSENATLTVPGLIFVIVTFIVVFMFLIYAQAQITTINLRLENTDHVIEFDKINTDEYKPFLAKTGNAESYKIQKIRGKPERVEIENSTVDNLVNKYFYEKNKYDGVVLIYTDAYQYLKDKSKNFTFSMEGYGLEPSCWIVRQNNDLGNHLLEDVNHLILKHRSMGIDTTTEKIVYGHLTEICKEYIKETNACLT